jgi:hypothetical protein
MVRRALGDAWLVGYLPWEEPVEDAVHHLGLELAAHAVDDGGRCHRPDVREPVLERVDAEEVVTVAVRDVMYQVLAGGRDLVGQLDAVVDR